MTGEASEERGEEEGMALGIGLAATSDMLLANRDAQDEPDDARRAESIVRDSDGEGKIKGVGRLLQVRRHKLSLSQRLMPNNTNASRLFPIIAVAF